MVRFEIKRGQREYPEYLASITDPPETLYCMGDPRLLAPGLAVIGSRRATPYGLGAARLFAGWAAARGVVICSGAALGCDQEAHRATLAAKGATLAVLACGADVDYPRGAAELLDTIRSEGLVISEQRWGTQPQRWMFARRNRIIAGLSHAVLVVEASLPSGTFSTADYALSFGRDVLAVPGSIFAPECRGANRLIRQGASPITDVSELAAELGVDCGTVGDCPSAPVTPGASERVDSTADVLLRALRANPLRPDDAARALALTIVEVSRTLGQLETRGLVIRYPDGRYGPCISMGRAIQSAHAEDTPTHT